MTCEFRRELTKLEKSIEETRRECETVEHLEWLRTEIRKVISRLTDIANDELVLEPPVEWPDPMADEGQSDALELAREANEEWQRELSAPKGGAA
jgi:sugar-specific transcriptional regulator TrmB